MKPTKSVKRMLTGSIGALIVTLGTIAPVAADHDDGRVRVAYQPAVDCVGDDRFGRGHTDCVGFYHGTHDHPSNAYFASRSSHRYRRGGRHADRISHHYGAPNTVAYGHPGPAPVHNPGRHSGRISGAGVVGAAVGGLVGPQLAHGDARVATTILGVIGGYLIGHSVEHATSSDRHGSAHETRTSRTVSQSSRRARSNVVPARPRRATPPSQVASRSNGSRSGRDARRAGRPVRVAQQVVLAARHIDDDAPVYDTTP